MASMLTCEICLEQKSNRKPKSLNCLHSFCRDCLVSWVDARSKGGNIQCPVCRQHTKIPPKGVNGLVDDFKVLQLEEMIKAIGDPFVCQGCLLKGQSSKAKAKCQTCDRKLCQTCYQYHSSEKIFEKYQVATDLCEIHGNGISHICITCFSGLCIDCILSEVHQSHEMYKLKEGKKKLQQSIKIKKEQLAEMRTQITEKMSVTEDRTLQNMEMSIAKLKQSADIMKQEIDKQVAAVFKRHRQKTMENIKAALDKFEEQHLPKSLDELTEHGVADEKGNIKQIIDCNIELNNSMRQVRSAEEHVPVIYSKTEIETDMLTEIGPPVSLQQFYDKIKAFSPDSLLNKPLFGDMSDRPKLVFQKVSQKYDEGLSRALEVMDDFTALVAFEEWNHAVRINENGKVLAFYHSDDVGDQNKIKIATVNNGHIYMLYCDDHTVIRVTTGCLCTTITHIANTPGNIYSFTFNPFNNTFIFSQSPPDGKVFCCRQTDMLPEESALVPGIIRVLPYAGSYIIVVASYKAKAVMVYDGNETPLYTLNDSTDNERFNRPYDVALLGHDILLVADQGNQCIYKFRLSDGSYDGLLLSHTDGLAWPTLIACRYPYLWVAGRWKHGDNLCGSLQVYICS